MIAALCEAVIDIAFERLADGLLARSVENAVDDLDKTIFFLNQKKGWLGALPGEGCESLIK
jgi:hypothetical protein